MASTSRTAQPTSARRRLAKAQPQHPSVPTLPTLLPFPVGQPLTHSLLSAALTQNRLASAYLFTGTAGVGKAMAARWLAAQILWQSRRSDACATQQAFLSQVQAGSYPDLLWVEPTYLVNGTPKPMSEVALTQAAALTAQIRMEQATTLKQTLQQAAVGSRWVVVIEALDRLTNEAGNALLKLLEDRANCTFILTTACPERVMTTIHSRAQTVPFVPLLKVDCQAVIEQNCPGLLNYPELLDYGAGAPGQAIAAYQMLCELPIELRAQVSQFDPSSPAEGVIRGLRLAKALSSLAMPIQRTLLQYLQHCLAQDDTTRQAALTLFDQTLTLLDHRVQAQAAWELLLCQCAMQGLSWGIELPTEEPQAGEADLDAPPPPKAARASTATATARPELAAPKPAREPEVEQVSLF